MKKLLCLFSASLLVLASCSSDDTNSSDSATSILPKKVVNVYGKETSTSQITYNGNKLVSVVNDEGEKSIYTYTGDLVTKIEEMDSKGGLDDTTEYTYISGKLATALEKEVGASNYYKTEYTHNSDGTVSYKEFTVDAKTGVANTNSTPVIGKCTFKDGNLVKKVYSYGVGSENTSTYEYDTKNNPFKNVLGFNLLLNDESSVNNLVKRTQVDGSSTYISTNTFKYDSNGFPTEVVGLEDGQSDGTTFYTY
jgi:hypothetical protein